MAASNSPPCLLGWGAIAPQPPNFGWSNQSDRLAFYVRINSSLQTVELREFGIYNKLVAILHSPRSLAVS